MKATPLLPVHLMNGTGHGGGPWGHGTYHGELEVAGDVWKISETPDLFRPMGFMDSVCRYERDGITGYGLFEFALFGAHDRYGFKTFSDVAP